MTYQYKPCPLAKAERHTITISIDPKAPNECKHSDLLRLNEHDILYIKRDRWLCSKGYYHKAHIHDVEGHWIEIHFDGFDYAGPDNFSRHWFNVEFQDINRCSFEYKYPNNKIFWIKDLKYSNIDQKLSSFCQYVVDINPEQCDHFDGYHTLDFMTKQLELLLNNKSLSATSKHDILNTRYTINKNIGFNKTQQTKINILEKMLIMYPETEIDIYFDKHNGYIFCMDIINILLKHGAKSNLVHSSILETALKLQWTDRTRKAHLSKYNLSKQLLEKIIIETGYDFNNNGWIYKSPTIINNEIVTSKSMWNTKGLVDINQIILMMKNSYRITKNEVFIDKELIFIYLLYYIFIIVKSEQDIILRNTLNDIVYDRDVVCIISDYIIYWDYMHNIPKEEYLYDIILRDFNIFSNKYVYHENCLQFIQKHVIPKMDRNIRPAIFTTSFYDDCFWYGLNEKYLISSPTIATIKHKLTIDCDELIRVSP
eukprot:250137_1